MAATFNGARSNVAGASSTTIATSSTISVAVGDGVQVGVKWEGGAVTVTCADNLGNTYTLVDNHNHSVVEPGLATFQCVVTSAGSATVTATFASARTARAIAANFFTPTGGMTFGTDSPGFVTAEGNSNAPSSGSLSINGAGIASAFFALFSNVGGTPGSGWTESVDPPGDIYGEYRIPSGSGSITGDFAWSTSDQWVATVLNLREVNATSTSLAWIRA